MTELDKKRSVEILITTAQINLISEQAEMVKDVFKYKQKQDFNQWLRLGDRMLKDLKSRFTDQHLEMFENMTDVYHNQSDSIRKQMLEDEEV